MMIGLVGFIGSGKGSVANILTDIGFTKESFAAPLKDAAACIFGWPREMLEGDTEVSRKWRECPDHYWSGEFDYEFSPRTALQLLGTEAGRNVFHADIWLISLYNRIKTKSDIVITDTRFKNEIRFIRDRGGLIVRVKRDPDPSPEEIAKFHISERDWIDCEVDYLIENNGDFEQLNNEINLMLEKFKGWYR